MVSFSVSIKINVQDHYPWTFSAVRKIHKCRHNSKNYENSLKRLLSNCKILEGTGNLLLFFVSTSIMSSSLYYR